MYCKNCGKELAEGQMYCAQCGLAKGQGVRFCQNCGREITYHDARNCPFCGAVVNENPNANYNPGAQPYYHGAPGVSPKSKIAAGLLQLFFGGFGIGRFYLGYTSIGIAQLLVSIFTCGLGSIWPFIDGILILCGNVPDPEGRPLRD